MNLQEIIAELLEHVRGMWRYRWLAIAVAWVVSMGCWAFVYAMPDVYAASARVSVDTNQLLDRMTKGLTANENIMGEVALVSRALLSRPSLEVVARETDLDLRAVTDRQKESLITSLQQRISVRGGRNNIFDITFEDKDRQKAIEVVTAILNTFIESALGAQGEDSSITERALQAELANHEERLVQAEERLSAFKKKNLGYMPNDGGDYYVRLQAANTAVRQVEQKLRLLQERRNELRRQIGGEEPVSGTTQGTSGQFSGCSRSGQLAELQGQLSALQVDFTDKHPRIVTLKETIASLADGCAKEMGFVSGSGSQPTAFASDSLDTNPVYQNMRIQLSNAEVELASLRADLKSKQSAVGRLRVDVDKIAKVETELKRLNRDYGVIQGRYQEMLKRWETLQSKNRLDPMTDSVQFTILEPPFVPAKAVGPNRPLLLILSLLFALGAGAAIAFALNQLNPVFYTRRTISKISGVAVLGTVSMILSADQLMKRRWQTIAWGMTALVLIGTAFAIVGFESQGSMILRDLIRGAGT